jgi:hypothetical protein
LVGILEDTIKAGNSGVKDQLAQGASLVQHSPRKTVRPCSGNAPEFSPITRAVKPGNPNNYIKIQCFAFPSAPPQSFYNANCDSTFGFPVCINLRGNAGCNILTDPALANVDFSIFKNNRIKKISETFNVQFHTEISDILNHANFAVPVTPDNTDLFDSTGAYLAGNTAGFLSSTSTSSHQIQRALKVVW